MNYTVLGATVNLAARLEPLNKSYGTEILVSQSVVEKALHRFAFRFVDTVKPKGFEEPVPVYELLSQNAAE
jgi:adenylate cyclase